MKKYEFDNAKQMYNFLLENGDFDYPEIKKAINEKTALVTIQRSKGYQTRKTLFFYLN